jgi:hypothetical protein
VRPGLVAIGVAFAIIGAVVGYTAFTVTGSTITVGLTETISAPNIAPNQDRIDVISLANTSAGTFVLSWTANQTLTVNLYQGVPCTSVSHYCASGAALVTWPSNGSGDWRHSGRIVTPYLLSMYSTRATNVTLEGSLAESYPDGANPPPATTVLTILSGGILLVTIGGLSLFLGLFLRGNVYSEPESVMPRYAHELGRPGDPLDEPFEEDLESDEEPAAPSRGH